MGDRLLVACGDAGLDVIIRPAGLLEHGDDTPGQVEILPGGQAANVSVWARTCEIPVHLVTSLGRDPLGDLVRAALRDRGVSVTARRSHRTTRVASLIARASPGDRSLVADLSSYGLPFLESVPDLRTFPVRTLDPWDALSLEAGLLSPAGIVYISGYALLRPSAPIWVGRTVRWARRHAFAVAASPSAVSVLTRAGLEVWNALARSAQILLLNRLEAEALTGMETPEASARQLAAHHALVLVTDGERGAWLAGGGRVRSVRPWPVRRRRADAPDPGTVDTTGAGDATAGVFLGQILKGTAPLPAARKAMRAGYLVSRQMGAWPGPRQSSSPSAPLRDTRSG